METLMKIDSNKIKKLREARSWSQEHLSNVAGLSLRTIQRVEAEGSASAETKMAIASAFDIATEVLMPKQRKDAVPYWGARLGLAFGWGGAAVGTIGACIGVASSPNTGFDAGVAYGLIGLFAGLSFALVGVAANRYLGTQASA